MSREMKDVSVYFSSPLDVRDVLLITHRLLEEFPCRILPEFTPWFPNNTHKPIRPQKPPPLISCEELRDLTLCLQETRHTPSATDQRQKHADIHKRKFTGSSDAQIAAKTQCENESKKSKRSWCVITDRSTPVNTHLFSRQFRKTIEKHKLHLHQRVKWVVCEQNCPAHSMEDVWVQLNRAIRHSKLPTCNANFQRDLPQIWVYCDVSYCEDIGNFLKQEFQLSGQITLTVHKHGDIITL